MPDVIFGIILKLKTSPSFPIKFVFVPEYETNRIVFVLITLAVITWSCDLDEKTVEFSE